MVSGRTAKDMGVKSMYTFCEVFSGVQNIARDDGFGFEQRKNPDHNLHTRGGLLTLLVALALTMSGSAAWIAPTCASWLSFVSRSTSGSPFQVFNDSRV